MPDHPSSPEAVPAHGGLAQYFVDRRGIGWAALVVVLVWGWFSYQSLAQQEDPIIPQRVAVLVTQFPGAPANKIDELVTRPLEAKISEMQGLEVLESQSRVGLSVIKVTLQPGSTSTINQEWEKLRAKVGQVQVPEGCYPPLLDTDFGDTITLLFAVRSPALSDAECRARAHLVRTRLRELRPNGGAGRAAVVAFFPPDITDGNRIFLIKKFLNRLNDEKLGQNAITVEGDSLILADFATSANRAEIERFVNDLITSLTGQTVIFPDFAPPLILMGDEDPLPQLQAAAHPRYSYRQLRKVADTLTSRLKQVQGVGRVTKIGTVQEAVHLYYSQRAGGYPVSFDQVTAAVGARNALIPGGTLRTQASDFPVQLSGAFRSDRDILDTIVGATPRGSPVYLRDVVEVERGYEDPLPLTVDVLARDKDDSPLASHRSVLVAVQMKEGQIIREFNDRVMAAVDQLRAGLPDGIVISTVSDQPEQVAHRIHEFTRCLAEAVAVVILVSLLLMNWRSALVVALAIPLTIALTLGGMALLRVPLHQISIGALIISLGMLVDDPVVASDAIDRELAEGQPRHIAAWLGPHKLRRPIFFGTLINIFAFLPLLLLPGDDGSFIAALPIVVTLALAASRLVSMTFVPLIGYYLLRGQKGLEHGGEVRGFFLFAAIDHLLQALLPVYRRGLHAGINHPWLAVGIAYGLLAVVLSFASLIGTQFFPPAEGNRLLIDIQLPQSASLTQTRATVDDIVTRLKKEPRIDDAAVFVGGSAPRFYYNVEPQANAPNTAQVLVNVRSQKDVVPLMLKLRADLDRDVAGARCLVKQLIQGPPVDAPIQVRFVGDDLDVLRSLADQASDRLRDGGAYRVYDTLEQRTPALELDISQDRANTLGVNNAKIGQVMRAAFTGIRATELREGGELIPVLLQLRIDERITAEQLANLYIETAPGQGLPLSSFATLKVQPQYQVVSRYQQKHAVMVNAFPPHGELADTVLKRAQPNLDRIELPPGYRLEYAGEFKQLADSQNEMTHAMMVSMALIALTLMVQFSSVMKAGVVMLAVPLGLIGAVIGLLATNSPLGFMALLAVVSLAGVIVSHIIVLSDYIEEGRAAGLELTEALIQAGLVRLRPVLVTVLATVGALVPLYLSGGALWAPLCAVHICGLLLATMLTLVILPVLYYLFARKLKWIAE